MVPSLRKARSLAFRFHPIHSFADWRNSREQASVCLLLVLGEMQAKQLNPIPIPFENSLTPDFGSLKIEAMKRRLRMKAGNIIKAAG